MNLSLLAMAFTGFGAVPTVEAPVEAWVKRHGTNPRAGVAQFQPMNVFTDDRAETTALAVDADDSVVVTGHALGIWHTAKYAATNGALLWEQHGPSGAAQAVAVDAAGNAVAMGSSNIIKYAAANGAVLWEQNFNGLTNDGGNANAMAMDDEGNVVATGSAGSNFLDTDFYTAKYASSDGALLWEVRYNGPDSLRDGGTAVAVDSNGNVVVTGYSSVGFQSPGDHYTAKYAATDGCLMWEQRHPGVAARSLVLDTNGDAVTTGPSGTFKYAADNGALLWSRTNANPGDLIREARALTLDSRGDIVVVGQINWGELCSPGGQVAPRVIPIGSYAAKYAAGDGALLWYHEGPACWGTEGAEAVMIDSHDNVVILGAQFNITKRSGRDGALLWETRYTGEDSIRNEHASNSRCLGLTSDGSVLITGGSDCAYERASTFIESRAFATVKYVMTQVTYPTPVVLSLAVSPDGACLRFTGDAGRTYRLQRASDPAGPWSTFAALTAPPGGAVEHLDVAPLASPAFYRIAAP